MTNEQVITRIKHNSMYKDDRETADYIIKALEQNTVSEEAYTAEYTARKQAEYELWKIKEQQPSEDCVSRQAVKEGMIKYGFHAPDMTVTEFIEDELPPVTPKIPTSNDCVSRADLLAQINESWETIETKLDFVNIVKASPSVTSKVPALDDCVSREQALLALTGINLHLMNAEELIVLFDKRIKALPPITPTQRWIPVSEKLPEDRNIVLVTAYWHETYQVMEASYYGDGLWWCVPFNNCGDHMKKLNPKAWQPLPQPYEEK